MGSNVWPFIMCQYCFRCGTFSAKRIDSISFFGCQKSQAILDFETFTWLSGSRKNVMKENQALEPRTNGNGEHLSDDLFKRQLLATLTALQEGNFSTRMPGDLTGLDGKIADAFNKVVGRMERFGNSVNRLR